MIGIDEVGRGAWAGPLLVVAARQIQNFDIELKDSKLLSKIQRESIFNQLQKHFIFGEGWVSSFEIDDLGLANAMRLATGRSLRNLKIDYKEYIIFDGNINYCDKKYLNVDCIIKADQKYAIVSAASIYAKVTRDNYMNKISKKFSNYGFENNVGYGTQYHKDALIRYGVSKIHRKSFKPIRELL
jgi:ribonuclease HII